MNITLILTVTLISFAIYFKLSTPTLSFDVYNRYISGQRKNRVNVLFFAYYRSGSTYLSQILNYHPEIFYLFEPLYITNDIPSPEKALKNVEILKNYYTNCKLPLTKDYLTNSTLERAKNNIPKLHLLHYCQRAGICFHYKSNLFKKKPFCNSTIDFRFKDINANTLEKFCPVEIIKKNLPYAEQDLCRHSPVRAAKIIRLKDINSIPLSLDVKTVQLIRDPRAIIASRNEIKKYKTNGEIRKEVENLCNSMNVAFGHRKSNSLYLVRYEDFVLDPLMETKSILDFIGLKMHRDIISRFTRKKRSASRFTTTRTRENSMGSLTKFIFGINFEQINVIQKTCSDVFENFHYKIISLDHFNSMKNVSVFKRYNLTIF